MIDHQHLAYRYLPRVKQKLPIKALAVIRIAVDLFISITITATATAAAAASLLHTFNAAKHVQPNRSSFSSTTRSHTPTNDESSYTEVARWPTLFFLIFLLAFIIMLAGICGELTVGSVLVANASFGVYVCAQVFAAILALGSILSADPISIPMYTLGLFKMFYPEVTSNIIGPFRHPEVYHNDDTVRFAAFFSVLGLIPHHFGATLCFASVIFHETDIYSIALVSLAVCLQHLFVFIKYILPMLYVVVVLGLEVWFQLESYYLITLAATSVRIGIVLILFSHDVWIMEGCLLLYKERMSRSQEKKKTDKPRPGLTFDQSGKSMRLYRTFADAGGVIPEGGAVRRQSFGVTTIGQGDLRSFSKRGGRTWELHDNDDSFQEIRADAVQAERSKLKAFVDTTSLKRRSTSTFMVDHLDESLPEEEEFDSLQQEHDV